MLMKDLCKPRVIGRLSKTTPILVPSYSSRGFFVRAIHQDTKNFATDAKLVSAFDLHYKQVRFQDLYDADLVFIDSGHYERYAMANPGEPYEIQARGKRWKEAMYWKVLGGISSNLNEVVCVSYDLYKPMERQIKAARRCKNRHPKFALDFLIKPEKPGTDLLNIPTVVQNLDQIGFAEVLGFTEKELGRSYQERANNLAIIRTAMNDRGLNQPIHVFGCLDPFGTLVYHAAGADIFDGLSWLRFAWRKGLLTYIPNAVAMDSKWSAPMDVVALEAQVENLNQVRLLQRSVRSVSKTNSFSALEEPWDRYRDQARLLIHEIGIQDGGGA